MKITVIKKSASRVNPMSVCPIVIDNPPERDGKQR
jgi:hypothetical protein